MRYTLDLDQARNYSTFNDLLFGSMQNAQFPSSLLTNISLYTIRINTYTKHEITQINQKTKHVTILVQTYLVHPTQTNGDCAIQNRENHEFSGAIMPNRKALSMAHQYPRQSHQSPDHTQCPQPHAFTYISQRRALN